MKRYTNSIASHSGALTVDDSPRADPILRPTRRLALLLAIGCLVCPSCAGTLRNPFRPPLPPAPEVLAQGASLEDVIAAVNNNSDRLQSLQTTNASISLPGTMGLPLLKGKIAAMRPGRLHLEASTGLSGKEVDLGANDDVFWFWVRQNEPPAMYFARRDQLAQGAAAQWMPIDPQWLIDVLGFARLDPADRHEGPGVSSSGNLEIRSAVSSLHGPMTRLMVIHPRTGCILEQHAYDASGKLVASAVAREHRYFPAEGVSLPQKMELRLPAADLNLTITMGTPILNVPMQNEALWTMPTMPGVPLIDLGNAPTGVAVAPIGRQLSVSIASDPYALENVAPPDLQANEGIAAPQPWQPTRSSRVEINPIDVPQIGRLPQGGIPATQAF